MLWRKAWLECRYRFYLCFFMSFSLSLGAFVQAPDSAKELASWKTSQILFGSLAGVIGPIGALVLAGSGINTQTNWGMMQGFHPSMYFLLSLPVTRERLLRIRAALGLALTAVWLGITALLLTGIHKALGVPLDFGKTLATLPNLFIGTLVFYAFAVCLTAFLDEFWAGMVALTITGLLSGYGLAKGPGWINFLDFMMQQSLAELDAMAWLRALTYVALSGLFYWAAWRIVESKEY